MADDAGFDGGLDRATLRCRGHQALEGPVLGMLRIAQSKGKATSSKPVAREKRHLAAVVLGCFCSGCRLLAPRGGGTKAFKQGAY